jgi:hypothetical protein
MQALRLPHTLPASLRSPSFRGTPRALLIRSLGDGALSPRTRQFPSPSLPDLGIERRCAGLPGSWGSRCWHALLSDPGEVVVDWSRITTVLPSALLTASALATSPISRLHHTACLLPVYASQYGSPHDHARLGSGCGPAWPGGVGYPRGSNEKFPPSSGFPLSQASPGARIVRARVQRIRDFNRLNEASSGRSRGHSSQRSGNPAVRGRNCPTESPSNCSEPHRLSVPRSFPMVVPQRAAEPFRALNLAS